MEYDLKIDLNIKAKTSNYVNRSLDLKKFLRNLLKYHKIFSLFYNLSSIKSKDRAVKI